MKGMSVAMAASEDKWRIESDLRTLCEAREIEKDSKRHAAAKKLAKEKLLEMAQVAGAETEEKGK